MKLSNQHARRFMLRHHYLLPPRSLDGKDGILKFIGRVGCIQYDPLDRVGRNADLVLQSRIQNYDPSMLYELLYEDRQLLDGWDKNASIYALEDWPYFKRYRAHQKKRLGRPDRPAVAILDEVRRELRSRGPLSSGDLQFNAKAAWSWGPTRLSRAALESMYAWGELIIHHKVGTRKVYDLANRHLRPELLDAPEPNVTEEQYFDWHALRRIGSVGVLWAGASDAWLEIPGFKAQQRADTFARLVNTGAIVEVDVEGIARPLFVRTQDLPQLERETVDEQRQPEAAIIAPLDNLLWDRRLIRALFGFEYVWEVYKPVAERKYGYYVLPILYGDEFVARFEPSFDQASGVLTIHNWWWESESLADNATKDALIGAVQDFMCYLGAQMLQVSDEVRPHLGWLSDALS